MNVGIIGWGKIGQKRAKALGEHLLMAVADPNTICELEGVRKFESHRNLLSIGNVDTVIIATPHNLLAPIAIDAIKAGKHVLIEKPGAMHADELATIFDLSLKYDVNVAVGYNLRYHRSVIAMKSMASALGPLFFIRCHYGHGGRVGYDTEWRLDAAQSGGGVLIDLGVHLIDLARMFLGEFEEVNAFCGTYYWHTSVEDNAFFMLTTKANQAAQVHVSATEWRNNFTFELVGQNGKLVLDGLGGSYGTEKLTYYDMHTMGIPNVASYEYLREDDSFALEFNQFAQEIKVGYYPRASLMNAIANLHIVEKIYDHHKIAS